ncbi:Phage holin family (Lysis protein S) [compost metagenome]|jgi:lambda family phage holin
MKMSDPSSDPNVLAQLWASVPEPLKAAVMNVMLSTVMAFRNGQRTFWTSFWEVTGGGLITFMAGSAVEAFGLSNGWCFAIGGAVAVFGIDQVKAFASKWAEKKTEDA